MKRSFFLSVALSILFQNPAFSLTDQSAVLYRNAADYYHKLANFSRKPSRDEWSRSIALFRKVYSAYPDGAKSAEAVYMTGKIYKELYGRFHGKADRQNAIKIFRLLVKSHSYSSLADDALYLSGEIYRMDGRYEKAVRAYTALLRWFPEGDMIEKAKARIRTLKTKPESAAMKAGVGLPVLKGVRFWNSEHYARVVFDLSSMVYYKILRNPAKNRISIELLGAMQGGETAREIAGENGLIDSIKIADSSPALVAITISLNLNHTISSTELQNPARIVVDLFGEEAVPAKAVPIIVKSLTEPPKKAVETPLKAGASGVAVKKAAAVEKNMPGGEIFDAKSMLLRKSPARRTAGTGRARLKKLPSVKKVGIAKVVKSSVPDPGLVEAGLVAAAVTGKIKRPVRTAKKAKKATARRVAKARPYAYGIKTIVIDPGHGGKDPGAVGRSGLKEKNVVLDIGLRLRKILKAECGCRVIMTRNRDIFIPLVQRTAIANSVKADLFISIHVNSNTYRSARGVETYFLSPARSRSAMLTAARENMIKLSDGNESMDDINFIFLDMKNTERINQSSLMARNVQNSVVSVLRKKYGTKDNGVKSAMFYVLRGARMPSVLVEASFISNRSEEKRLKSGLFLQRVAEGIARGIRRFTAENRVAIAG
jgi:N-acetylmuramoyl-L-alanine amidase